MAHLTDDELKDLKGRVIKAMGTGANVARANDYILQLIREVEERRQPKPRIGTLKVGEMEVKKAVPPEPETSPVLADPKAETAPPARISERNIPTVPVTPEEQKELVAKTKAAKSKGKKKS